MVAKILYKKAGENIAQVMERNMKLNAKNMTSKANCSLSSVLNKELPLFLPQALLPSNKVKGANQTQ